MTDDCMEKLEQIEKEQNGRFDAIDLRLAEMHKRILILVEWVEETRRGQDQAVRQQASVPHETGS